MREKNEEEILEESEEENLSSDFSDLVIPSNSNVEDSLLDSRILYLYGDLSCGKMNELNKKIIYLSLKDSSIPITLYINSTGGDVLATLAVCDIMKSLKVPIKTIALGECQSAALYLLASGTYGMRYATKNCVFMTHRIKKALMYVDSEEMMYLSENFKELENIPLDILSKYRQENKKEFQKYYDLKKDYFFNSKKAKKYKLIDKII